MTRLLTASTLIDPLSLRSKSCKQQLKAARAIISQSSLFDPRWYVAAYPDVAADPIDPMDHFLIYGAHEGRNPGPLFNTHHYLALNPDLRLLNVNALVHYLSTGKAEGRKAGSLFDPAWYLARYPDIASSGLDPFQHFEVSGMTEGRQPNQFFDPKWYAAAYPERVSDARYALFDYTSTGWRLGCQPGPLFSPSWYRMKDASIGDAEPLMHFLAVGRARGAQPSPFFDAEWYLSRNLDVASSGLDPLDHFLSSGAKEGRQPNIYFNPRWYLDRYPDRVSSIGEAFFDYTARGWREGCDPGPRFSITRHLSRHSTLGEHPVEPLQHFLSQPEAERGEPERATASLSSAYVKTGQITAAALTKIREDRTHVLNRFYDFEPMNIEIDRVLSLRPAVSIVLPGLNRRYATGGPNTAYILGCLLASRGLPVNFVSLDAPPDTDLSSLKLHLKQISGVEVEDHDVRFLDAHDRETPFKVGYNDVFLATAWWTAYPASAAASLLRNKEIFYLIQDYESLFYGLSTSHANAQQTYSLPHHPIINTKLLLDQLIADRAGLYENISFSNRALYFDPAVDRNHFYKEPRRSNAPHRFLFYTRPTMAERNLFGLGVAALRAAVEAGVFDGATWEFIGMGEGFEPIPLGRGYVLNAAPWMDFEGYGELMRSADILLSLMMSPHPSYPPLEMAACRGIAVTTTYGVKSSQRLTELSDKIIGVPPTIEAIVEAIVRARIRNEKSASSETAPLLLPNSWREALLKVVPTLMEKFAEIGIAAKASLPAPSKPELESTTFLFRQLDRSIIDLRSLDYRPSSDTITFDVLTRISSIDGAWLTAFAEDLLSQDSTHKVNWFLFGEQADVASLKELLRPYLNYPRLAIEIESASYGASRIGAAPRDRRSPYILVADAGIRLSEDALRVLGAFVEQSAMPDAFTVPLLQDWNDADALLPAFDKIKIAHGGALNCAVGISWIALERRSDWMSTLMHTNDGIATLVRRWIYEGTRPVELFERIAQDRSPVALLAPKSGTRIQADGGSVKPDTVGTYVISLPEMVEASKLRAVLTETPEDAWLWLSSEAFATPKPSDARRLAIIAGDDRVCHVAGCVSVGGKVLESAFWFGGRSFGSYGPYDPTVPQEVGAASARGAWVRAHLLLRALSDLPAQFGLSLLGPWLGALAQESAQRVVLDPGLTVDLPLGFDLVVGAKDARRFALRFGDLGSQRFGRPFRSADPSIRTPESPRHSPWFAYKDLLEERIAVSRERLVGPARPAPISILTTVYIRTDPALFQITADSIRDQIRQPAEWIILAHGPIPEALGTILDRLEADGAISLHREPVNLGIHGGLGFCLERARQPFALCLDADDVLTEDAVELLDRALHQHPDKMIFYTDEDLLIGDRAVHAFLRPDYDPVHLRVHSFIWHSILFSTEEARKLGAFSSSATQYAQDWDILLRFEFAGFSAWHLRHVIYHWRQHEHSLSNSGETFQGSLDSVQAALEFVRQHSERPDDTVIRPYPANAGMPDFFLERLPRHSPSIAWISLGQPTSTAPDLPASERFELICDRGTLGVRRLREILAASDSTFVFLMGATVELWDKASFWHALRHFELCPTTDFVGGVISRTSSEVVAGPSIRIAPDWFRDRPDGSSILDRGTDLLSGIKALAVDTVNIDLVLARRTALLAALEAAPDGVCLRSGGYWIGRHATRQGRIVVYEPLLRGVTRDAATIIGDTARGLSHSSAASRAGFDREVHLPLRGAAGLIRARALHER